jgi:hypothetical protein
MARLLLSVMGAFAVLEHALIRERQREGIGGMVPVCTVVGLTRSRPRLVRPPQKVRLVLHPGWLRLRRARGR